MRAPRAPLISALCATAWLVGCVNSQPLGAVDTLATHEQMPPSDEDAGGNEGLDGPFVPVPGYPAPHAAFPRVQSFGGPVLASPRVVPIFFAGDADQSSIEDFLSQLSGSAYWSATTSEYGVGSISVAPSIVVADAPPATIDDAAVMAWLSTYLDGTHPEFGVIDANSIYAVFYPQATTITLSGGAVQALSCQDFGGYHQEGNFSLDGGVGSPPGADGGAPAGPPFVYAVLPRCATFSGLRGIDVLTTAASHEIVESATDPLVLSAPAFASTDEDHLGWVFGIGGGEVGDLCISESSDRVAQRFVGPYMVQRTWSNQAAHADEDPCVPPITSPYIGAAPDPSDTVFLDLGLPQGIPTLGTSVPVGQSATLPVHLFSTGPTADWTVTAIEAMPSATAPKTLSLTWDKRTGHNGDVLQLTVTRLSAAALGATPLLVYSSDSTKPGSGDVWATLIGN